MTAGEMAEMAERAERVPNPSRLKVRKLGLGDYTEEGAFYPVIDGEAFGVPGRSFWPTKAEAMRVGIRILTSIIEHERGAKEADRALGSQP